MDGIVGMIKLVLSNQGAGAWLPTDGRMLDAKSYPELFAMIGERFGGDGNGQFALPNLPSQEGTQHVLKVSKEANDDAYQGFVAQMVVWAGTQIPENWMTCDGQLVLGADYPLLHRAAFAHQMNMPEEFHLPKMETIPGLQYIICVQGLDANALSGAPQATDDDDY